MMPKGRFAAVDRFMRETDPAARVQLAGDIGPIPGVNGAGLTAPPRHLAEIVMARIYPAAAQALSRK